MAVTSRRGAPATTFEYALDIARPIEEVFAFVADSRNDPRWCPRVVTCEQVEGEGPQLGARYEAFHRPSLQRPHLRRIHVQEFDHPRLIRSRQEDNVAVFTITYQLEPAGTGTRLAQRDEIEWRIPRRYVPLAKRIVRRHIGDQLENLKRLLEREAEPAQSP
jgi:hypothetical protein